MTFLDTVSADVTGDDVFYDIKRGFGETITYAAGTDFIGIWEEDYQPVDAGGYSIVSSTAPACWCRSSDAPAIDETINRNATDYIIVDHQPNDDGETLLILRLG